MKKQPNLLFILTDDQGAWAMHCAGNGDIRTPNLDRLARQGTRFENFFCASPVCSPARASILTGRIPSQHGVHDWIRSGSLDKKALGEHAGHPYFASEDVPIQYLQGLTTYPDLLAARGYTCALAGKWHLGDSMHPQHGFSHWYTIGRGGCLYNQADVIEDGALHFETRYITDLITEHALGYLDEFAGQENPFYISVHYTAPHDPWDEDQHPAEFYDLYRDCAFTATPDEPLHPNRIPTAPGGTGEERKRLLRGYYAAVSAMDAGVGRLLDKLEELGLAEDTLVVFTADNGMNMGHHGIWGKGNGTRPMNMFDSSVKVPFLIAYPPLVPAGTVCEDMVSAYDFFPTLLDLLGFDPQTAARLPGHSFLPCLRGESLPGGEVVVFDEYGPVRMIRSKEYKLVVRYPYGYHEFYDLTADPGEEHNLYGDPQYEELILSYRRKLEKWFNTYADPDMDGSREGVTGSGQLCSPGLYAQKLTIYAQD